MQDELEQGREIKGRKMRKKQTDEEKETQNLKKGKGNRTGKI